MAAEDVNRERRQRADLVEHRRNIAKATNTERPKETAKQHVEGFLTMALVGRALRNIFGGGR